MPSLPASGPLSLATIGQFFGDTAPYNLSSYYRGGGKVPNIAANNNIPTSGAIAISDFYGAQLLDPIAVLTLWWNKNAYLTKAFDNANHGTAWYANTVHWGRGSTTYRVTWINPPDTGGGGG